MTLEERNKYAQTMFEQHPELFPEENRSSILNGIVMLGMTPFEARLAGGAFTFRVVADKAHWSDDSDPLKVMWGQSMRPDNSEIWMTFKNSSQFSTTFENIFRVYFEHGKAIKIEKLVE